MTEQKWKLVEQELNCIFGSVNLECDGYKLYLRVEKAKSLKHVIAVYVNGYIKGKYMSKDSEVGQKFYFKSQKYLWSKKQRDRMLKAFGKRAYKKNNWDEKYTNYLPYFSSFRTLKKEFTANCKEIKLLKIGMTEINNENQQTAS